MSLEVDTSNPDHVKVRFTLDIDKNPGAVSVVGTFNDWVAGLDVLIDTGEGVRSVRIGLPYGQEATFRYLGPDGAWFDDPDADEIIEAGSVLHAIELPG